MIIKQLLYSSYNLLKKLGVLQTLYYFKEKTFKKNKIIKIIFDKHNYYIRPNENDLKVLFSNLEKENTFEKSMRKLEMMDSLANLSDDD